MTKSLFIFVYLLGAIRAAPFRDLNSKLEQARGIFDATRDLQAAIFTIEPKSRETAKNETESLDSRLLTVYEDKQKSTADFFNAKPIVDTIKEDEKYGNNGDKFYPFTRALVDGYEAFANFMNKILDAPSNIGKSLSSNIIGKLDNIGGKLVGL